MLENNPPWVEFTANILLFCIYSNLSLLLATFCWFAIAAIFDRWSRIEVWQPTQHIC